MTFMGTCLLGIILFLLSFAQTSLAASPLEIFSKSNKTYHRNQTPATSLSSNSNANLNNSAKTELSPIEIEKQRWSHTGLKANDFLVVLTAQNCNASELSFWGCLAALNAIITLKTEGSEILRLTPETLENFHGPVVRSYEGLEVRVLLKEHIRQITSPKENYEFYLKNLATQKRVLSHFRNGGYQIPFDKIREDLLLDIKPQELNFYTSMAANALFQSSMDSHYGILLKEDFDKGFLISTIEPQVHQEALSFSLKKARDGKNILYVKIDNFREKNLCSEFTKGIQQRLRSQDIYNIVIDLRNNMGGFIHETLCMVGAFAEENSPLISTWSVEERKINHGYYFTNNSIYYQTFKFPQKRLKEFLLAPTQSHWAVFSMAFSDLMKDRIFVYGENTPRLRPFLKSPKIVILTNGLSASSSEIFAGVIQDLNLGAVVGSTTFGKGCVQDVLPFAEGVMVKKTTSRYHLPSGRSNQKIGIVPDFAVFKNNEDAETEAYLLKENEISPLSPEAVPFTGDLNFETRQTLKNCAAVQNSMTLTEYDDAQLLYGLEAATCF